MSDGRDPLVGVINLFGALAALAAGAVLLLLRVQSSRLDPRLLARGQPLLGGGLLLLGLLLLLRTIG